MKKIFFLLFTLTIFSACTEGFENLNENPNQPKKAGKPELILKSAIFELANITSEQAHLFTDIVSQYAADYQFNDLDLYKWQGDDRFWYPMYAILEDLKDIKSEEKVATNNNYKAVALILEAYIFSIITDAYGDVPMSEANRAEEGILTPKYDKQQDIYKAILAKLVEANNIADVSQTIEGDAIYKGNMLNWKKFANSLRLRLLLRINKKQDVTAEMTQIITNSAKYPIFTSNSDNAIYNYSGNLPDISPISKAAGGRGYDYFRRIPTQQFIDLIKDNDPRLELWISPRECKKEEIEAGTCVSDRLQGTLPGQSIDKVGTPGKYSRRSAEFFTSATKIQAIFMTFSELNFILAEAKQTGIISTGTTKEYYDKGVEASFTQWGLTMPTDFLTATAPYNASSEVLYQQKWLALYHTGIESWLDFKRTGKPSFIKAGPDNTNGGKVPVRMLYPSLEQSVNKVNYDTASSAMGGDTMNASSWWW